MDEQRARGKAAGPAVGVLVVAGGPEGPAMQVIDYGRDTGLVFCRWTTPAGEVREGGFVAATLRPWLPGGKVTTLPPADERCWW